MPGMLPMSVFWPNAPIQRHRERDQVALARLEQALSLKTQARRDIHNMIKPILCPVAVL